jgi:uncharacterized membrane protein YgdD (TMEM256/DUF423 family)
MNVELLANLLLTGALVSYVIWHLRREKPSWTEVSIFAAVGIVLVSGSIFLAKLLNEVLAPESIMDILLLTRFRMVPGGAIPLGYVCILVALWRSLQLLIGKQKRGGGVAS